MKKNYNGCWPTMITPFTEDNKVDFNAIDGIVEWYIQKGCHGIFAVCQSSEMFFLTREEKIAIATAVVKAAKGRVKVIASGHTEEDLEEQIEGLRAMWKTGVDAVVLVSNRFAKQEEGEDVFRANADKIFEALPEVTFGMYECPYPYRRLVTTDFLTDCAQKGRMVFLKDVCCSTTILKERIDAIKGTDLALLNANTATLLDSFILGADGYNGVMANFHIDVYKWMYENFEKQPELAKKVSAFLTVTAISEMRAYPVSAKYHMNCEGVKMSLFTRSKSSLLMDENATLEIDSLICMEKEMRNQLGL